MNNLMQKNLFTTDEVPTSSPTIANTFVICRCGQLEHPTPANRKYKTIVIDPPWQYGNWGAASKNSTMVRNYIAPAKEMDYPTMTIEEIKELPVNELADTDCELYIWTTQKYLPATYEVIKHWGFRYCTTITWCKKPMGKGQGGVYCPTTEFLVHGRIGKMPKVERIDSTWFEHKRQSKHSKKPEFFQDMIETVTDCPRLEMFARRERKNWDVFGNEVANSIQLVKTGNNGI